MLIFELERVFSNNGQQYIQLLYKTLFAFAYYGLMRVSEIELSDHVVKARDVHLATTKKIRIMLYSSKTHDQRMRPQKIIITANKIEKTGHYLKRYFCPIKLTKQYMAWRGDYDDDRELFFISHDKTPVTAEHAKSVLKQALSNLGLNPLNYGIHSFRVGRTLDLIKYGYTLEEVKHMGRWCSNTIYKYIR